jgi:hypothetical protein
MARYVLLAWIALAALTSGCGKRDDLVPVRGRVILDGQPVRKYSVSFIPTGKTLGNGALAGTDSDGRFTLIDVRGKPGIRVGEYKVSFYPFSDSKEGDPVDVVAPIKRGPIPTIFIDGNRTPLRATIPDEGATVEILLTKSGEGATVKVAPGRPAE